MAAGPRPDGTAHLGVLHPAVAVAAHRAGAAAVGLVCLGRSDADDLRLDEVGVAYDDGRRRGDPSAPVQVEVTVRGGRAVPDRALPAVVSREAVAPAALGELVAALDRVPAGAVGVVTTAWTLAQLGLEGRLHFLQHLAVAATHRPVAWVSLEGVGVAPAVPTLGDRPASGHTVVGVALLGHRTLEVEVVARCWSRGRFLAWLGEGPEEP